MDVLDAGVYVSKWEAHVPKHTKMTLWGPLQAREMGLDGWDVQDGGETGFVFHNAGTHLTMGRATSTLIFVRRLEKAFLTIYFGGYPADASQSQRRLDMQKAVGACQIFLTRLAKQPVTFEMKGEITLVDNLNDAVVGREAGRALGGGRRAAALLTDRSERVEPGAAASHSEPTEAAGNGAAVERGEPRRMRGGNQGKWDASAVEGAARPKRSPQSDIWEV